MVGSVVLTLITCLFTWFVMFATGSSCNSDEYNLRRANRIMIPLTLLFLGFAIVIPCMPAGTGVYEGKIVNAGTNTVFWDTNGIIVQPDLGSQHYRTFAVPNQELFNKCLHLQNIGAKVHIRFRSTIGYIPWIGDSDIVTDVESDN